MSDLRNALIDAVTLYRDAKVNTRQVPDGLNAIIACAGALVDSWLPTADDVRGILAAPQPEASAGLRNVEAAIDGIVEAHNVEHGESCDCPIGLAIEEYEAVKLR